MVSSTDDIQNAAIAANTKAARKLFISFPSKCRVFAPSFSRYGAWIWRVAAVVPGYRSALERLRTHAETSAALAAEAGCSPRTVELIRHQDAPNDPEFGELLRLADEAN